MHHTILVKLEIIKINGILIHEIYLIEFYKHWIEVDVCVYFSSSGTIYFMAIHNICPIFSTYVFRKGILYFCRIYGHTDSFKYTVKKIFSSLYEPILVVNKNKENSKYTFNYQEILFESRDRVHKEENLLIIEKNPPRPHHTKRCLVTFWDF